jgi:hypothetical protein
MNTKPSIDEEIRVDFIRGLVRSNVSGYYISLEMISGWFSEQAQYDRYIIDPVFRNHFKAKILRNSAYELGEAEMESDLYQDFIIRKGVNNIGFPWFSTDGFKHFCMLKNTKKSKYIYKYYKWVERDYYKKAIQYYEDENNVDGLIEKIERLTIRLMEAKKELKKCREERNKYRDDYNNYNEELDKHREELDICIDDRDRYIEELDKCRKDLIICTSERNRYSKELEKYSNKDELNSLMNKVNNAMAELNLALKRS